MVRFFTAALLVSLLVACSQNPFAVPDNQVVDIDKPLEQTKAEIAAKEAQKQKAIRTYDPNQPIPLNQLAVAGDTSVDGVKSKERLVAILQEMDKTLIRLNQLLKEVGPRISEIQKVDARLQSLITNARQVRLSEPEVVVREVPQALPTTPYVQQQNIQNNPEPTQLPPLATATGFRVGDHIDYLRAVVDFLPGAKVRYEQDFNPATNQLTIRLKRTSWQGRRLYQDFPFKPFIRGYKVAQQGSDAILTISMSPDSKIDDLFILMTDPSKPRLVLDLVYK